MIRKRTWGPVVVVLILLGAALLFVDSIREGLQQIPAVGWAAAFGAVVAAVISVAGIVASNYSSMTRLYASQLLGSPKVRTCAEPAMQ